MGRRQNFNRTAVLAKTAQQFRRVGYSSTSLKDLERVTGLLAGSLYHAFGNKKEMLLCSLDAYHEGVVRHRLRTYLKGVKPLDELAKLFTSTYRVEGLPNAGCLLTNTAAEIGGDDPEIQAKVEEGFAILREGFVSQMRKAKNLGLTNLELSPETAAEFLLTAYQGLLVRVRNGTASRVLDKTVRVTIRAISQTKPTHERNPSHEKALG